MVPQSTELKQKKWSKSTYHNEAATMLETSTRISIRKGLKIMKQEKKTKFQKKKKKKAVMQVKTEYELVQ